MINELVRIRGIRKPWILGSALTSLVYFMSIEAAYSYCSSIDIYRNFSTDALLASVPTYFGLVAIL